MTKGLHTLNDSNDWFLNAIKSNGSVGECLDAVLIELEEKATFVKDLAKSIAEKDRSNLDSVSEIGQRIKTLENTLRFRLSILSPERKGAWFRIATAASGPFKESLLIDPVFSLYDEMQHGRIRSGFMKCWDSRSLVEFPLRSGDPSIWRTLLSLNYELESMDVLSTSKLRISELPALLPTSLESRPLRAFLTNVRAELLSHRHRLSDCYRILLEASERYWMYQATAQASTAKGKTTFKSSSTPNNDERTPTVPRIKSFSDIEALRFMGFLDYPSADDLKQRYHSLARAMHPDRPSGSEQRFKMLNKSYKHLSGRC